jgi:hypothetical protein
MSGDFFRGFADGLSNTHRARFQEVKVKGEEKGKRKRVVCGCGWVGPTARAELFGDMPARCRFEDAKDE